MINYKFLLLCFLLLFGGTVMAQKVASSIKPIGTIVYDAEDKGSVTAGNLSVGKFYRFSREPDTTYKDEYSNNWSDGAKLTDEALNTGSEFNAAQYVGWKGTRDLEITIDLGRIQSLEKLNVNGLVSAQLNAQAPVGAAVFVKQNKNGKWILFNKQSFPGSKTSAGINPFSVEVAGPAMKARFVKLVLKPSTSEGKSGLILLDELSLMGKIKNTWRSVPAEGCFHEAFPTSVGYSKEELAWRKGMVVDLFEKQVGKQLSMVLWYRFSPNFYQ